MKLALFNLESQCYFTILIYFLYEVLELVDESQKYALIGSD